jgi:2-iminobutanoate/2-iminopropanoate deaminase
VEKKIIQTKEAPAAIGPYSQAIAAGPFLFVSGQLGLDPATGNFVGSTLATQARQALTNMKNILEAGGSSLEEVVAVDVFLADIEDFLEFNGIYGEFFSTHKPARAAVEVSALPKRGRVELKCIACRKE